MALCLESGKVTFLGQEITTSKQTIFNWLAGSAVLGR